MAGKKIVYIPVEHLYPHPENPRKDLGDLTELADSIKVNGVLQNLTVVPLEGEEPGSWDGKSYRVVIGHRCLAAAKLAGLSEVPSVVEEMTEVKQVKTMLMENIQRNDLTVYEQAQGFQLMLDMGGTVESVAKDTGFSQVTVRRRLKMMELDQKKLKEVADDGSRQIRLEDFDELAKIEDVKERNKALSDIGTNNFKNTISYAIRKQEAKRRKPLVLKWLKSVGATKIERSDGYSNRYTTVGGIYYRSFYSFEESEMPDVSQLEGGIFYCMDDDSFTIYTKTKKPPKEKKSKAQLEKERKIREAWKVIDEAAKTAHELRKASIDSVVMGSKNKLDILTGAVYASMLDSIDYNSAARDEILSILGVDGKNYDPQRMLKAWEAYANLSPKDMPKLVYALFGDGDDVTCTDRRSRADYPGFERNAKLEMLYNWLWALGYTNSDEETAMMNGTHEVYQAAEEAAK